MPYLLVAVLASPAWAGSDIGTEHTTGLGLATGNTLLNATFKQYVAERYGIAASVGTSVIIHEARVAFEGDFVHIGEAWSWGRIPLFWYVAVDAQYWAYEELAGYSGAKAGLGGGVGAAIQFGSFPLEIYTSGGLAVYPVNTFCDELVAGSGDLEAVARVTCTVSGLGQAGVRWYF